MDLNPAPTSSRGRAAIRATSLHHVDEDIETAFQEEAKQQQAVEDREYKELLQIANLMDHPGWQILKGELEKRISDYRSGAFLKEELKNPTVSNARIGELTRVGNMVADELLAVMGSIVVAREQIAQRKEERTDGNRRQPRGI